MSKKTEKDWNLVREEPAAAEPENSTDKIQAELNAHEGVLNHPSYIELSEKLTLSEQQAHENWEKSVRAMAELENVRRRAERDVEHAHRYGQERLIKELLPVLDSMEQALQAAISANDESMIQGIELTHKLMLNALVKVDVKPIEALGNTFNPNIHEAMVMQESDEPANTVINVFQQGYLLGERVIRPSRVVVAKSKS
ncbi:MAG: nucleotide exchange factor GrpE [Gammaproteobacteria bacterium]|nr:nucleotide exchange factor GrpE [Gammaproteobacteria bacterium]